MQYNMHFRQSLNIPSARNPNYKTTRAHSHEQSSNRTSPSRKPCQLSPQLPAGGRAPPARAGPGRLLQAPFLQTNPLALGNDCLDMRKKEMVSKYRMGTFQLLPCIIKPLYCFILLGISGSSFASPICWLLTILTEIHLI